MAMIRLIEVGHIRSRSATRCGAQSCSADYYDPDYSAVSTVMTPTEAQKRLVIIGATGMIGGYALRCALDHSEVGTATAIGRKPTGLSHQKIERGAPSGLHGLLRTRRAALWPRRCGLLSGRLHRRGGRRGTS